MFKNNYGEGLCHRKTLLIVFIEFKELFVFYSVPPHPGASYRSCYSYLDLPV